MRSNVYLLCGVMLLAGCDDDAAPSDSVGPPADAAARDASAGARGPELDAANAPTTVTMDAAVWSPADAAAAADAARSAQDADFAHADAAVVDTAFEAGMTADADASDDALQRQLLERLRACNVVGEGEFNVRVPEDVYDRCMVRCQVEASCDALRVTLCAPERVDEALGDCGEACSRLLPPDDGFPCDTVIPHSWTCDLSPECAGGEDELNCGSFACADGVTVPSRFVRCDGRPQCADGSDEDGCAAVCLD